MINKKDVHHLIESCIAEERNTLSNPFLSTRIMSAIQNENYKELKPISLFWKTIVVTGSLAIVLYTGYTVGNLYQNKNSTTGIVLMNDDMMENFSFLNKIGSEK